METSDFALVDLPPDLAQVLGHERIFVEAMEMVGAAVFRGAHGGLKRVDGGMVGVGRIEVPSEHEATLEALFVAARQLRPTDDVLTIRDADHEHAKERAARTYGRHVEHSRNPIGRRGAGKYK